eukprot:403339582
MGAGPCCATKQSRSYKDGESQPQTQQQNQSSQNSNVLRSNKSTVALINQKIESAKKLRQLNINDLAVKQIDERFNEITQLSIINAVNCQVEGFKPPEGVKVLERSQESLRKINMSRNLLQIMPVQMFSCQQITVINMSHNKINSIPNEISSLINLREIDLSHNQIKTLPDSLAQCSKLTVISMNNNQLTQFSLALLRLPALEFLYLAHNQITQLPAQSDEQVTMWRQSGLKVIDLESNDIYHVPAIVFKESKVHNLNLKDNHIKRNQLMNMEGIQEYQDRRKIKMDIVVNNNLDVNYDLCGLDK